MELALPFMTPFMSCNTAPNECRRVSQTISMVIVATQILFLRFCNRARLVLPTRTDVPCPLSYSIR